MVEKIHQTLRDSKAARWSALVVVAFTMLCGYFMTDVMAPLEDLLMKNTTEGGLGWSGTEYGVFTGAYGWFNVFAFMLIFGGIILDKMGVRFTGVGACLLMFTGAMVKFYAISSFFPMGGTLFGFNSQVVIAGLGFAIFGMGVEIAGITVSKIIVKWFTGYELALALGLQVAVARIGTALALSASLPISQKMGHISYPILLGAVLLCIGTIAFLVYNVMDFRLDKSMPAAEVEKEESFKLSDIKMIITNKGFWLIAILCVLFYSGVFPFLKFATKLMIYKYDVNPEAAGNIPAVLPFGTILLTPLFGSLYDRIGKGATLMIIGSFMLIAVHFLFALPLFNVWWFAVIVMIVLGVAFSLVPSAMWPSVPKIIPQKQLGSAYALIFWVQNIGLMGVPMLIGWAIEHYAKIILPDGKITYDYTIPMSIFTLFGVLAVVVAFMLKCEDKKKGYGLEKPNMQKAA